MIKTTGQKLKEEGRLEATVEALQIVMIARFGELNSEQNRKVDEANLGQLV